MKGRFWGGEEMKNTETDTLRKVTSPPWIELMVLGRRFATAKVSSWSDSSDRNSLKAGEVACIVIKEDDIVRAVIV